MYSLLRQVISGDLAKTDRERPATMTKNPDVPDAYDLMQKFPVPDEVRRILDKVLKASDEDSFQFTEDALQCFKAVREFRTQMDLAMRQLERDFAKEAWRAGASWADLGKAAGITRQTAQQTYRDVTLTMRRRSSRRDDKSWPEALEEDQ